MTKILLVIPISLFFGMVSAQNVGIGITPPTAKLHVNGGIKLEGNNLFEFGAGIVGKEVNAGKIGYNAFGQNALTFIGAGTSAATRSVYFYAEGGTTFTGPVNIGGTVQLNGNAGIPGQVLSSNGAADPTWANTSYSNNTRFGILFSKNTGSQSGDANIWNTLYNLNTTNVVIGATTITINKTGLYHFDIELNSTLVYAAAPAFFPKHELWFYWGNANPLKPIYKQMDATSTTNTNWAGQEAVSVDVYITAPATLNFYHRLGATTGTGTNYAADGYVMGYLISE